MIGPSWRERLYLALSPRAAAFAVLLYCFAHAAVTLASGPALALDDVKLNILTQSWQAGYLPDNPPLFEWALIIAQGVLGPTLASFAAVKYFFLIAAAAFTFLALKEATNDARASAAGALLLPLIPQIGWSYHQTLTHSAALVAAAAFFWFALLRAERRRGNADFALLGLSLGLGALSKYAFLPAALIALAVAAARPSMRNALLRGGLALTIAIAGVLVLPHLFWLAETHERSAALFQERLIGPENYWTRIGAGLPAAIWAIISYFAPLLLLLFIAGRQSLRRLGESPSGLLFVAATSSIVALLVATALLGMSNFQERYALAFLFPGYLWLIAASAQQKGAPGLFSILLGASAAFAFISVVVRAGEIALPGDPFCRACRQHIPYAHLRDALAGKINSNDTLAAFDDTTAGNLRRLFPKARVVSAHQLFYSPPATAGGDCLFIWSTDIAPSPSPTALAQLDAAGTYKAGGPWARRMNGEKDMRETWWMIGPVEPSTSIRKVLCRD